MKRIFPVLCDASLEDGALFFFDNRIKALCKADLADLRLEILAKLEPGQNLYGKRILVTKTSIIIQHHQTADLFVFDKESYEFKLYKSKFPNDVYNIMIVGTKVYIIPLKWTGKIYLFDIESKKYAQFEHYSDSNLIHSKNLVFRPYAIEERIYFPSQYENSLYEIDTEKHTLSKKYIANDNITAYIAIGNGLNTWVIEKNTDKLYQFGNQRKTIDIPGKEYGNLKLLSNHICLLSKGKSFIVIISKNGKGLNFIETEEIYEDSKEVSSFVTGYVNCIEDENYIYFIPNGNGKIIRWDKESHSHDVCSFVSENYMKILLRGIYADRQSVIEDKKFGLTQFLEML